MSLQDKYRSVLDLGEKFNTQNGYVEEADGKLRVGGTVETQYQKDRMWDEIKKVGGETPRDIEADIRVTNKEYYAKHTVQRGDSLSKMSKDYYGDPMQYKHIFEANKDILDDPNLIHPGQELTIPFSKRK